MGYIPEKKKRRKVSTTCGHTATVAGLGREVDKVFSRPGKTMVKNTVDG